MARKKSIQDIHDQYGRILNLSRDLYNRDRVQGNEADRSVERARLATRIGDRYITNLIKAQTKGFTEEELDNGRAASYDRKMGRSARMGINAG